MSYIEPYASSTSELVVELLQYQDQSNAPITKIEATAMLGGIQIDTKTLLYVLVHVLLMQRVICAPMVQIVI